MKWKMLLRFLITAGLLYWLFSRIDLAGVVSTISKLSLPIILLAITLNITSSGLRAIKWKFLLPLYPLKELLHLTFISYYYAMVLPGQLAGEAAKVYILGNRKKNQEQIAASVLLDKVMGTFAVLLLCFLGLMFSDPPIKTELRTILLISILATFVFFVLVRIPWIYRIVRRMLNLLKMRVPSRRSLIDKLEIFLKSTAQYFEDPFTLVKVLALSLLFQLFVVIIKAILGPSLGIHLSFFDWMWVTGAVSILTLLPITIGGIGLREGLWVGFLGLFGVRTEVALSLSLAVFGLGLLNTIIGAVIDLRLRH